MSWLSCNIILWTGLDQFPGRHRDLGKQNGPIRRQDSLQSFNKLSLTMKSLELRQGHNPFTDGRTCGCCSFLNHLNSELL